MKKLAVLFLAVLFSFTTNGQKCSYLSNKVSGMDGSRLVITNPVTLSDNFNQGSIEVWATLTGDTTIVIAFVFYTTLPLSVAGSDTIQIFLANNDTVNFMVQQDASAMGTAQKKLTAVTILKESDIPAIESSPVTSIELPVNLGRHNGQPSNKKQAAAIQKVLGCVKPYFKGGV
jgi:hypothetical protein